MLALTADACLKNDRGLFDDCTSVVVEGVACALSVLFGALASVDEASVLGWFEGPWCSVDAV